MASVMPPGHARVHHGLVRRKERLSDRLGISLVGRVDLRSHRDPALDVHRVLDLVGHVRAAVLQPRDPRVSVRLALPLPVRDLLAAPLAVDPLKVLRRRVLDPLRLRQLLQVVLVRRPVRFPHDRLHRRVRFQGRRVDGHLSALENPFLAGHLHDPLEDVTVDPFRQLPPPARQRRVVRRLLCQLVAEKLPQRHRVGAPPGDPALGREPLEVPHQRHSEVDSRGHRRPPHSVREDAALLDETFHELVETVSPKQVVQRLVEDVPFTSDDLAPPRSTSRPAAPGPCVPSPSIVTPRQTVVAPKSTHTSCREIRTFATGC